MPTSENLIIFTSSPTGLGHIRVMDALRDGLPIGSTSTEVGMENVNASKIHTLGSRSSFFLKLTEFIQNHSLLERIYTFFYTSYLRKHKNDVIQKFQKINDEFKDFNTWVIVSTHFALAHTIAAAKSEMGVKFNKKIYLALIVTDDSPQRVWVVKKCDIVFVPSEKTAIELGKLYGSKSSRIEVSPFPISPRLTQPIPQTDFQKLVQEADPEWDKDVHIEIPVSGAAVQLDYITNLVNTLYELGHFQFTIVGQQSKLTEGFFNTIGRNPKAQLTLGESARQTVNIYESLFFQANKPLIEVTKPSEQAFKAIIPPTSRGGVILLLTPPVGRQEYDNLNFLIRHDLVPNGILQNKLEELLLIKGFLPIEQKAMWLYQASHFRAIRLPKDPKNAALFIQKLKDTGIILSMLSFVAENKPELAADGVTQIWQRIWKMVQ